MVLFRPRLRLAPRPVSGHASPPRSKREAVVVRLDDWRAAREEPVVESPSGAWLILTLATMLLSMLALAVPALSSRPTVPGRPFPRVLRTPTSRHVPR